MKSAKERTLISAAFRKLVAETRIEKMFDGERSVAALTRHFQALPWDTKVFTVTGQNLEQWTVDVDKNGPALTLTPADSEIGGKIAVDGGSFWKHLAEAFEESHPGLHLGHDENLLERLFHDHVPARSALLEMIRRHDENALRTTRMSAREAERRREEQWRADRAGEHQAQYAIWYQ